MTIAEMLEARSIPEPNSGCTLWTGHTDVDGYGILKTGGRPQKAHRLAWVEARGPIPDGLCVCHKCDIRACINPDHLWLGTQAENIKDRDNKGRHWVHRGADQYSAKLTEDDVRAIRASNQNGVVLGERYGISHKTVSDIRRRTRWRHVA